MKVTISEVPRRIVIKSARTEGILNYDIDNAYPQRVSRMVGSSGTARNCVNLYGKFLAGRGFSDDVLAETVIDRDGMTINALNELISKDFAQFGGFAVHINYNLLFEPIEYTHVPFEHTRLTLPGDGVYEGKPIRKISTYWDWAREFSRQIKKDQIRKIDLFDKNPEAIAAQIEAAGGIDKYNGQIFWYSNKGQAYPLPVYDPVLEDIDTDAQLKTYRNSNVRTGFSASHIFIHKGKFEDEGKRQEHNSKIAEFQGADVAGSIMVIEVENDEQIPELIPVKSQIDSRVIKVTNNATKDNIIESFGTPSILVNAQSSEGMTFSNDLLKLSYEYYNSVIEPERTVIEKQFEKMFDNFPTDLPSFQIVPLKWAGSEPTNEPTNG